MKNQHTPGPWTFSTDRFDNNRVVIPCSLNDYQHGVAIWTGHTGEAQANARLIAAAPELLVALRVALDRLDYFAASGAGAEVAHARGLARAAIATAEGTASAL